MEKLVRVEFDTVPIPMCVHPSVSTVVAFDNIDRQEEVRSGARTSHHVNGIIVHPTSSSSSPPKPVTTASTKDKKHTIKAPGAQLPIYVIGKRNSPPIIGLPDLTAMHASAALRAGKQSCCGSWCTCMTHLRKRVLGQDSTF